MEKPYPLMERTKAFAVRIVRLYSALPRSKVAQTIGQQLLRLGISIGAHYREKYRSRSTAEFISKLEVGIQELEETRYWIELLVAVKVMSESRVGELKQECTELVAIFTASIRTAKSRRTIKA